MRKHTGGVCRPLQRDPGRLPGKEHDSLEYYRGIWISQVEWNGGAFQAVWAAECAKAGKPQIISYPR